MSTDIVPVVVPTEEENRPTEVERDSSDSTALMVPLAKQDGTILSKMVSGNDHDPKTSVDYIMSGMSEIKQMLKQILSTLQPLPSQVSQAALDTKLCSAVTELHEKVQKISEYCATASVKEKEMRAEQQMKSENMKEELEQKIAQLKKQHEELQKHCSGLKELNDEKYKQEIEKCKAEVQMCKQEVTEIKIQKTKAENLSDQLEKKNEQHQNKEAKHISQIEELQKKNEELQKKNEELKSSNKDQKHESNEQKTKNEELHKENEKLTRDCEELKKENKQLKNKLETEGVYIYAKKQERKVEELEVEIKNLKAEIKKLKDKNEELKKNNTTLECNLAGLKSRDEGKQQIIDHQKEEVAFHREFLRETHSSVRQQQQNQLEFTKEQSEKKMVVTGKSSTL